LSSRDTVTRWIPNWWAKFAHRFAIAILLYELPEFSSAEAAIHPIPAEIDLVGLRKCWNIRV
jgi:hypothetical protein